MKNKLVWVAVFLSVTLIGGGVFFYKDFERSKLAFYNARLIADVTPAENPALKTNDTNLAMFYQWTKEDPLFTGPGFNMGEFSRAVSDISKEQTAIIKTDNLKYPFLPITFWNDIIEATNDHNSFIADPSRGKAERLIGDYHKTLDDYKNSVNLFLKAVASTGPANLNIEDTSTVAYEFFGINNISSLEVVEKDIYKLKNNASVLENEINKRQSCLEMGLNCERPSFGFQKPDLTNIDQNNIKQVLLPQTTLLPFLKKTDAVYGPYAVSTSCFGWNKNLTAPEHLFYIVDSTDNGSTTEKKGGFPIQYAKLATDNYYRKFGLLPDDNQFKNPIIPRVYMRENTYLCLDSTYPGRLANLNAFFNQYKDRQIYNALLKGAISFPPEIADILETGLKLENDFFESRYPSEEDAKILSDYYAYTYKVIGDEYSNPIYKNQPWLNLLINNRSSFLSRYLFFHQGVSDLDLVFTNEAGELSRLKAREIIYDTHNLPFYDYVPRGMYGLAYFSFSPAFYRLPEKLDFFIKNPVKTTGFNNQTLDYHQAILKFSPKTVDSWVIKSEQSALEAAWKKFSAGNTGK